MKPINSFSAGWISSSPQFKRGITSGQGKQEKIDYKIIENNTSAQDYYWKVKNSDASKEPRGEITLNKQRIVRRLRYSPVILMSNVMQ